VDSTRILQKVPHRKLSPPPAGSETLCFFRSIELSTHGFTHFTFSNPQSLLTCSLGVSLVRVFQPFPCLSLKSYVVGPFFAREIWKGHFQQLGDFFSRHGSPYNGKKLDSLLAPSKGTWNEGMYVSQGNVQETSPRMLPRPSHPQSTGQKGKRAEKYPNACGSTRKPLFFQILYMLGVSITTLT